MEEYAEEHSNLSHEIVRSRLNIKADKAEEELLKIEYEAAEDEVGLLKIQFENTQNDIVKI